MHVLLPQPSLFDPGVERDRRRNFLLKAAELTRTGVGLPAYYNDEVIIPALMSRGLTLEDARDYNIIGCVEPQKAGKTDGWHDAAFFNMCRPLGAGVFTTAWRTASRLARHTGDVVRIYVPLKNSYDAYKKQMNYAISLLGQRG